MRCINHLCIDASNVNMDDEQWADINVITGILKLYLRELQNPLLTFERYTSFIEAASKPYGYTIINFTNTFFIVIIIESNI
jgi:hypothetical protein